MTTTDEQEVLRLGLEALDVAQAERRLINPPTGAGHAESLAGMLRLAGEVEPHTLLRVFRDADEVECEPGTARAFGSLPEPTNVDTIIYRRARGA